MRHEYKFVRRGDVFAWEGDFIKIEFSDPRAWPHSLYKYQNKKSMLYLNYTLTIWVKKLHMAEPIGHYEWTILTQRETYHCPMIKELRRLLNYFLKDRQPGDGWGWYKECGTKLYTLTGNTGDSVECEDFYEITKKVQSGNNVEWYDMFISCAIDPFWRHGRAGVSIPELQRGDLEQLELCVKEFQRASVELYNTYNRKHIEANCASHRFVEGKLYQYYVRDSSTDCDYDRIECIYMVGDEISDGYWMHLEEEAFWPESYGKSTIAQITEKEVVLANGEVLPIDRIYSMYLQTPKKNYDNSRAGIVEDMLALLTEEDKQEFRERPEDELVVKYGKVLEYREGIHYNRMEQHGFAPSEDIYVNYENARFYTGEIICDIKARVCEV
ncbi:MAG: hypothetical protein IJ379_11995 [Lachnospiraceae bacterium]|nr:hypothetical protein [Lachnospiraceae bacterium]